VESFIYGQRVHLLLITNMESIAFLLPVGVDETLVFCAVCEPNAAAPYSQNGTPGSLIENRHWDRRIYVMVSSDDNSPTLRPEKVTCPSALGFIAPAQSSLNQKE
jgi:hypothetical protein